MLLNDSEALAKYLSIKREWLNLRLLRSYLSYLFKVDLFDGVKLLKATRRVTLMVLVSD